MYYLHANINYFLISIHVPDRSPCRKFKSQWSWEDVVKQADWDDFMDHVSIKKSARQQIDLLPAWAARSDAEH